MGTCGGYALPAPSSKSILPARTLSVNVCPLDRKPYQSEVFVFGLLRDEALSRLAGSVVTKLWSHDVLQAAQTYPAVWHAGLAMAAMHKRSKIRERSAHAMQLRNDYYSFSLLNYNASIRSLMEIAARKQISDMDRETFLISSLLFLCLCSLQNRAKEAIVHAQSGINLYYQWQMYDPKVEAGRNGILSIESLMTVMTNLEFSHVDAIGHSTMVKKWHWRSQNLSGCSPVPFRSLSEAYLEFAPILNVIVEQGRSANSKKLLSTAKEEDALAWERYKHEFKVWKDKLRNFQEQWTPKDDELEGALELEMFSKLFTLSMVETTQAIEMHWDRLTQQFEELVAIGEHMCELQTKTAKKYEEQDGAFRLSFSPGEVLYFVVSSCRDRLVRRRVISLLRRWKRRNGMWDTAAFAALSETLVMYEEGASSNDNWCECVSGQFICHGHRTGWIKPSFGTEGEMVMRIKSVDDMRNNRPGVKYVLHV